MEQAILQDILADFAVYRALIREQQLAHRLALSGGCYQADRFSWSRVKNIKVHFDERFCPREIERVDLGVTYRLK